MSSSMDLETQYCAHNYQPLPVVITRGEGVFVWDDAGKKYLDMMSAYSAVSHGHANPRLVNLVQKQVARLTEDLAANSATMGEYLTEQLRTIHCPLIRDIRGKGLFVGVEIDPAYATARAVCEALMKRGLLSKEAHETVVRLAPPLNIGKAEIDWAVAQIRHVLDDMDKVRLVS